MPDDSISLMDQFIAEGRLTPPEADLCELELPSEQSTEISISEALQELREERLNS